MCYLIGDAEYNELFFSLILLVSDFSLMSETNKFRLFQQIRHNLKITFFI